MSSPDLSLAEWMVLALVAERPAHGFAVAGLTSAGGEVGRYWYLSQPMVYRSITRLADRGLLQVAGMEEGERGPNRTIYAATDAAREAIGQWLRRPVDHLRDARASLLVKLVLLQRRKEGAAELLERQRDIYEDLLSALQERLPEESTLERAVVEWRIEQARASLRLLERVQEL